jgi:hypothetical protein
MIFSEHGLTSVTIPAGVTFIGYNSFFQNDLTSITIPAGVTYIGKSAFGRNKLTSVTLPPGITYVGERAFSNNKITSVVIPPGVAYIGEDVFVASGDYGDNSFNDTFNSNGKKPGTYLRSGSKWTWQDPAAPKPAAAPPAPAPAPAAAAPTPKPAAPKETPVPNGAKTAVTTADVNMRSGPSSNTALVTTLKKGATVAITGNLLDGWVPIEFNGKKGYVSSQYVTFQKPSAAPAKKDAPQKKGLLDSLIDGAKSLLEQ